MPVSHGGRLRFARAPSDVGPRALEGFARRLQAAVTGGRPFDCLIAGDAALRRLNREFRGEDRITDVLSFPVGPGGAGQAGPRTGCPRSARAGAPRPVLLGGIAISLARARSQARRYGHSTEAEVRILMLHGALHLAGFDHQTDSGRMARVEKRWRDKLGLPAGLIERAEP
jgi:probable rRNA maturation factor